jgi:hypothetical protein
MQCMQQNHVEENRFGEAVFCKSKFASQDSSPDTRPARTDFFPCARIRYVMC